ncbi:MAG: hypothetical protein KDA63_11515 [Planctomycetales bacterium]|nr:hypothetical protein [Planctomycetales bacterium]
MSTDGVILTRSFKTVALVIGCLAVVSLIAWFAPSNANAQIYLWAGRLVAPPIAVALLIAAVRSSRLPLLAVRDGVFFAESGIASRRVECPASDIDGVHHVCLRRDSIEIGVKLRGRLGAVTYARGSVALPDGEPCTHVYARLAEALGTTRLEVLNRAAFEAFEGYVYLGTSPPPGKPLWDGQSPRRRRSSDPPLTRSFFGEDTSASRPSDRFAVATCNSEPVTVSLHARAFASATTSLALTSTTIDVFDAITFGCPGVATQTVAIRPGTYRLEVRVDSTAPHDLRAVDFILDELPGS